jgi:protein involved in polysaccharide export with SLBB domain
LGQESDSKNIIGRLVIDMEAILSGKDEDIILEDGDRIIIPQEQQTISVIGEVFAPNAHLYKNQESIDYYIDQSGGATEFADVDNSYIIKADGSIIPPNRLANGGFFRRGQTGLEPGDTIVLPIQVATFSGLAATTEISEIVYQLAVAAAAVSSFSN